MPVKGPYSQVIQPNKFVDPMDLNIYVKGVMYKEQLAKENFQDISTVYNGLNSIPAEGPDARMLDSKIENLRSNLKNLNISNLGDMNTTSAIKQMIGEVSNDADVLNITRRSVAVQSERAKKRAAQEKRGDYTSPILDQADTYYSGDEYIRDLTFNQEGWLTPQMAKMKNEYLKDVPKIKKQVKIGNYWHTIESYDPEAYKSRLNELYNMPSVRKQMDYDFDRNYQNYDFATEGVKIAQTSLDKAKLQSQQAYALLQSSKPGSTDYNMAMSKYQEAQEFITTYTPLVSNPGLLGDNLKSRMKQDYISKAIDLDIAGEQFYSDVETKADQFDLNSQQLSNSLILKQQDYLYELEKIKAQGNKEVDVAIRKAKAGVLSGSAGDYLVRPDYDAFQNTVNSAQTKMVKDWKFGYDLKENITDYSKEPVEYEGKKIIDFTALPSNIQNIFLEFDVVKQALTTAGKNKRISGVIVDESDPSNKKYIPVISNNSGTTFEIAKVGGVDVKVDDNSIKLKAQTVKESKLPGSTGSTGATGSTGSTGATGSPPSGQQVLSVSQYNQINKTDYTVEDFQNTPTFANNYIIVP
jgi:hypothetical protein